jgi:hypothetical protein
LFAVLSPAGGGRVRIGLDPSIDIEVTSVSISHTRIPVPRLPTDKGLEPDAARAVLDDVARVSAAVQQTEATIAELAGIINKRQRNGFYGIGGSLGVLVLLAWNFVSSAYNSYTKLQETVAAQGVQLNEMRTVVDTNNKIMQAQQASLNHLYRVEFGDKAIPMTIDAATSPSPPVAPMRRAP